MTNPARDARLFIQTKHPGATVHARGRKHIVLAHPTESGRKMFMNHIGRIHYGPAEDQEIDTAWTPSSGAWDYESVKNDFESYINDSVPVSYRYVDGNTQHYVELTVNAILWVNDENDSEAAASFTQVTPTINDDVIIWYDIATGWSVRVEAQTERLAKWLNIDSLANLGSPTIGGTNIRLRMEFTWQKSTGLEVWADGEKWEEKNNTWMGASGDIEFRDEITQESVFYFQAPAGHDDSEEYNAAPMTHRVRRTGVNFYSEIDTPWSWLETATYPISLDATVNPQVGAGSDDAHQVGGVVYIANNYYIVDQPGKYAGFRWSSVTIPDGATINAANVDINIYHSGRDEPNHDAWFEDGSNPGTFVASSNNISNRTPTTATMHYGDGSDLGMTAYTFLSTAMTLPEAKTIIQELVDSYDYSSGNAMVCIVEGGTDPLDDLGPTFYETNSAYAAKLYVDYTDGGGPDVLTGEDVITAPPIVSDPTIGQTHILTGEDVATEPIEVDAPTIGQTHILTGEDVLTEPIEVDGPTIGQTHILTGEDVVTDPIVISDPILAEIHALTGEDVLTEPIEVDAPTIGQTHILTGEDVITGIPIIGAPTIGQTHILTGEDVATEPIVISDPTLTQSHTLIGEDVATGPIVISDPTIGQTHILTGEDVITEPIEVDAPTIGQTHILTGEDVITEPIVISDPILSTEGVDALTGEDVITEPIKIDAPTIGQTHILTGEDVATAFPIISDPTLTEIHNLTGEDVLTEPIVISDPTLSEIHILTGEDVITGIPIIGAPTIGQTHILTGEDVATEPIVISDPTIGQTHILTGEDVITEPIVINAPILSVEPLITLEERVYEIANEYRIVYVDEEDRTVR